MRTIMRITVEKLEECGACPAYVKLFKQFLNGRQYVLTTDRNIRLAYEYGLDVLWANRAGLIKLDGCYENQSGDKFWVQNGKLHRLDGPACEWAHGAKEWWIDGEKLTEAEFNKRKQS